MESAWVLESRPQTFAMEEPPLLSTEVAKISKQEAHKTNNKTVDIPWTEISWVLKNTKTME